MESFPLFSPTHATSSENVLHSIFSPQNGGKNRHYRAPFTDTSNMKTPGGPKPRKSIYSNGPTKICGTDRGFRTKSQSPHRPSSVNIKSQQPSSPGINNASHSPLNLQSFSSPVSTMSALSYSTTGTSSFQSVPIEMLSFAYVTECTSEVELQQIVTSLQADSPRNYPSLLKAARKSLVNARAEGVAQTKAVHESDSHLSFSMSHISSTSSEESSLAPTHAKPNIFRMNSINICSNEAGKLSTIPSIQRSLAWSQSNQVVYNSLKDDSSLVMSLSTTCIEDMDSAVPPSPFPTSNRPKETTLQQLTPGSTRKHIAPVSVKLQEQLQRMREERSDIERNLKDQVIEMSNNLENLEASRKKDHAELSEKLRHVENKKTQLEEEVAMLETAVRTSTERAKGIVASMASMRNESRSLRTALEEEKQNGKQNAMRANDIETDLREQVTRLSSLLVQSEVSAQQANEIKEMTMRKEFDNERVQHKLAAKALSRSLQDVRSKLQHVKSERSVILRSLGEALGRDATDVSHLNSTKRKELVDEVVKKLASSKSAIKAFAKALACSENDRRAMKEMKAMTEMSMADLKSLKNRLERENLLLTRQNQEIGEELKSSRAYIDSLQSKEETNVEWKAREEEYKRVISALKKQVRTDESKVSIALYQHAIGEARHNALKCKEKEQEILALRSNVGTLKDSLKKSKNDSKVRVKPNRISPTNETCSLAQIKVAEYHTPRKPLLPAPPTYPPVSTGKQALRITAVKAAGGRAQLCAKLRQMRRSPSNHD